MKAGPKGSDLDHRLIGPRLRAVRQERGLTLADVAAGTGLTKGFISLLERNETTPSVPSLLKICGFLEVRIGSLFEEQAGASLVTRNEHPDDLFGGFGITDVLLARMVSARTCFSISPKIFCFSGMSSSTASTT